MTSDKKVYQNLLPQVIWLQPYVFIYTIMFGKNLKYKFEIKKQRDECNKFILKNNEPGHNELNC